MQQMNSPADNDAAKPSNFLRHVIENDLEQGTYAAPPLGRLARRRRASRPGHAGPGPVRLRFPPEPNGYLHIGHAKSIWLNFELASEYGGVCHLRFDDTNPEKEEQEYVDAIRDAVKWLGYDTVLADDPAHPGAPNEHEYFASNYFDFMYRAAEYLIGAGLAYVDEQSAEEMRANRGDFNTPGTDSPFRSRTPDENLARFRAMRDGQLRRRRRRAAREDRHGQPQHQHARPGALPHPPRHAPQHRRQVVHLPDVHLRAPDRGRAGADHPQHLHAGVRGPAPLLRLAARPPGRGRPDRQPASAPVRVRAAQRHPRGHQQAQAAPTGRGRPCRRLGRPPHAHAGRPAPARLHARCAQALLRTLRRHQVGGWIDYASLEAALRDTLDPIAPRAMAVLDPVKLVITQLGRADGRRRRARRLHGARASAPPRDGQRAASSWAARSGSSAPTTKTCSPRASSASSPATRCG